MGRHRGQKIGRGGRSEDGRWLWHHPMTWMLVGVVLVMAVFTAIS